MAVHSGHSGAVHCGRGEYLCAAVHRRNYQRAGSAHAGYGRRDGAGLEDCADWRNYRGGAFCVALFPVRVGAVD